MLTIGLLAVTWIVPLYGFALSLILRSVNKWTGPTWQMTGVFLFWIVALAHAQEQLAPEYRGAKPPSDLLSTYARFVEAARAGDSRVIKSLVLPGASEVTSTPRGKNREYGTDINLPFLQNGFSPEIVGGGTEAPSEFSLRTATTAISFVKVESAGWRIYRYHDKPIE